MQPSSLFNQMQERSMRAWSRFKGRTIRKVMGGGGKPKKKTFMQGKMSEKKIHAQDGPHFDMKP